MKCVLVLSVCLAAAFSLSCKKGADVTVATALTDETCGGSETKCFKPKVKNDNTFMSYGCGDCAADKTADCETCTVDSCNAYVVPTYADYTCFSKKDGTTTETCTGQAVKTCYYVKMMDAGKKYAGINEKLKDGKFGGCGNCDQFSDATDKKFCDACETGQNCNAAVTCAVPTVGNGTVTPATAVGDAASFTLKCKDKYTLTAKVTKGDSTGIFNCTVNGGSATLAGKDGFICSAAVRVGSVMGLLATLVYLILQ